MAGDAEFKEMAQRLRRELAEAEAELPRLQARIAALQTAVGGLDALADLDEANWGDGGYDRVVSLGTATTAPVESRRNPHAPKGSRAAERVLRDGPSYGMSLEEMLKEYEERGWLPPTDEPANAIRAALNRLRRSGAVKYDPDTRMYRLADREPGRSLLTANEPSGDESNDAEQGVTP